MKWWKTSYTWITFALLVISAYGFAKGDQTIADPGQPRDRLLPLWYLIAAGIMAIHGVMTARRHAKLEIERKARANDHHAGKD